MKVCHILYSGIGGQAGVVFTMAGASGDSVRHRMAFYGKERVAEGHVRTCEALDAAYGAFPKGRGADLSGQWRMAKWIASEEPDVIATHNPAAVFAAKMAARRSGAKVVSVEHHSNALKGKKEWLTSLIAHRISDRSVYLTESYRDGVRQKLGRWFEEEKSTVIPNGIELSRYADSGRAGNGRGIVIGMQGRMVAGKDFGTLLRAAARLRHGRFFGDLRIELAGDGPDLSRLQRMVKELRLDGTVRFMGMLSTGRLVECIQGWDVFVLSTLGETMSMALMEAQACGLPVLATDVAGVNDVVVDGENGLLVAAGDDAAMALKLVKLISDAGLRGELGRRSSAYAAAELPAELMWERYEKLFVEVINDGGKTGAGNAALASV